jgi:pantetheine-phosphate adenylyltransferase
MSKKRIIIVPFNVLTIDLCRRYKASIIIRGLRAVSDFEYEFQLAGMNKKLNNDIETIFLMSDIENQIISSKFVKEIAKLNGNISRFLTKSAIKVLKNKFK